MKHGGKRAGAGRKPICDKPGKVQSFWANSDALEVLERLPRGKKSTFINKAILDTQ